MLDQVSRSVQGNETVLWKDYTPGTMTINWEIIEGPFGQERKEKKNLKHRFRNLYFQNKIDRSVWADKLQPY